VKAAVWPRGQEGREKLLRIERAGDAIEDRTVGDLPSLLAPGDLLIANDAATLPASLPARSPSGAPLEIRLSGELPGGSWRAVLMGAGDWRTPTEHRPPPEAIAIGETLTIGGVEPLRAIVEDTSPISPRLVRLRFDSPDRASLWAALYRHGRPIQYSYLTAPLELWHVQTHFAARPWAVEQPSAGRPLGWDLLSSLRKKGVALASLTHAAGLSSTGDPAIDAALPLPERYAIPDATVAAIENARGRIVAVGTSVVRALEGCHATFGSLRALESETDLVLGPHTKLQIVDGILTGMHEVSGSHYQLLQAFASPEKLSRAYAHAEAAGYLAHEFGDSCLIL
jgi:S-adenosylmethionine:tRNA ribosyltransferase-isomerase